MISKTNLTFHNISLKNVASLMTIERACHHHPWSEKTFKSCIGGRYFGDYLMMDNKIIGFYIAETILDEVTLMNICILPDHQGRGLAKALMKQFFEQCQSVAAHKIFLEVRASNINAQMLYINQGFIEISRRTGYYPSNKNFGYEDAIVMRKTL